MKAITTKYLCPTNFKGSRIKAYDIDGNSVTVSYRHDLNSEQNHQQNHQQAASALLRKINQSGNLVGGSVKNGMVFVFLEK